MSTRFVLCDVFAERPFAGNQLAVFPDAGDISETAMDALAREFGWSEITFVTRGENGPPEVRIWTPFGELPFAGHPTVGTAVVLVREGVIEPGWATLQLGIGPIAVQVETRASGGRATMVQGRPEFGRIDEDRDWVTRALGLETEDLANDLPIQVISTGLAHVLIPLRSLDALRRARASDALLDITSRAGSRWAYLFTTETPHDTAVARARLISPGFEDPATGSAAGPLGAYLVRYGLHRAGEMEIEQGVEMGRPSRIRVDVLVEGGEIGPVRVSGEVQVWAHGSLDGNALASPIL